MIILGSDDFPRVQLTEREIKFMFSGRDNYYNTLIDMARELANKTGDDRYMYFANLMRVQRDSIRYGDLAKDGDKE